MTNSNFRAFGAAAFLLFLFPCFSFADGNYHVGKDSAGMFFQTDNDGGWIVPKQDRALFKVGETGRYTKGRDSNGTYIQLGNGRKFYVDISAGETSPSSAAEPGRKPAASSSSRETKVTVKGNQVLVPVTLGYGEKELKLSLLLDTGASITTLNRDAVKKFQLAQPQKAKLVVPGGKTIDADIVQLSYIKVGPHKIPNLHAGIIDHKGTTVEFQGLLGMNFLKEVDYRIDFERQVIVWR
jgi:predicted aspartyl protease